mgnify:CR=1 FL=1
MTHKKFGDNFKWCPREELAISTRIFTKKYTTRIVRAAFEYAKKRGFDKITVCEKPNVIRETSGMMLKIAQEMSKNEYPDIWVEDVNIDAMMMWLTKNPENYNVIVAGNMFGDIVSDAFAGLIGGLGFDTSAQFNPETGIGVFEPTHGSAPKYAGMYKVNPMAMLLTVRLMLEWLDEKQSADRLEKAIAKTIMDGKVRTYDMGGANTTLEMAEEVVRNL